jgi:hypothetical protein
MSERPKREAVVNRDGTDTLLNMQRRRSTAEVQRDKALAASAKAAARAQRTSVAAQKKARVAAFEDQLRREDQQEEKEMARPDLASKHVGALLVPHDRAERGYCTDCTGKTKRCEGSTDPGEGPKFKGEI